MGNAGWEREVVIKVQANEAQDKDRVGGEGVNGGI